MAGQALFHLPEEDVSCQGIPEMLAACVGEGMSGGLEGLGVKLAVAFPLLKAMGRQIIVSQGGRLSGSTVHA